MPPHQPVIQRRGNTITLAVGPKTGDSLLLAIVIIRHHLQIAHDAIARMRMLVGELHHVVAVIPIRFAPLRLDDDGAVGTIRLLKSGVTVEPVGPGLLDRKAINKSFTRRNTGIADTRHAIHLKRQNQTVPVNRGHLVQVIGYFDDDVFALFKPQHWPRRGAVVTDALFLEAANIDHHPINRQRVFTT